METVVVILIVALAGLWGAARLAQRLKAVARRPGCGSSCAGCACSPQRLADDRGRR